MQYYYNTRPDPGTAYYWFGNKWGYQVGMEDQLPFLPILGIEYKF